MCASWLNPIILYYSGVYRIEFLSPYGPSSNYMYNRMLSEICRINCSQALFFVRHGEAIAAELAASKKKQDEHGGTWWKKHPDLDSEVSVRESLCNHGIP